MSGLVVAADLAGPWWWLLPVGTALLGALIGLGSNVYFRLRDERRETRAATRLVDVELMAAVARLTEIHKVWGPLMDGMTRGRVPDDADLERLGALIDESEPRISNGVWRESRFLLARHLDFEDWEKLRQAYAVVELWLDGKDGNSPTAFSDARAMLSVIATTDLFSEAREVCQRHADLPPAKPPLTEDEMIIEAVGLAEEEAEEALKDAHAGTGGSS